MVEQAGIRVYYRRPAGVQGLFEGLLDGIRGRSGRGKYP
jgi:hypothetical protein